LVFSSLLFIFVFLPLNLIVYYAIKSRTWKNAILIISSLFFYGWGEPVWITLLLFSSFIDYVHGLIAEKYRSRWQSKAALISSLSLNLGLLVTFKYAGMIVDSLNSLLGLSFEFNGFTLPIGISFYTFQTISYVFDVYRGEVKAQRSMFKFLMFVSLFHQLVAGPIVRYKDIAYEIEHRIFKLPVFSQGIERFIMGLGKKVIFANTAGEISRNFLEGGYTNMSTLGYWYGIILFGLQIYFDFSGYSDMAIGLGKMFGFTYKENFNYPYISKSATEFWRRWHISLGTFFRDYLYIPLGGNRKFQIRNIFIVWFLTGLWHGASWNFVVWGLYYGLLITIEKYVGKISLVKKIPDVFKHSYLMILTCFGWTLFYFDQLGDAVSYMTGMVTFSSLWDTQLEIIFMNNAIFLFAALVFSTPIPMLIGKSGIRLLQRIKLIRVYDYIIYPIGLMTIFVISFALLVGQTYNPFLYFRF
jgi:alginate O-acetyltransferase complex protein AlgI